MPEGIQKRHQRTCAGPTQCNCKPTYQVQVWSAREHKRITRTFKTEAAARGWRDDARGALRRGELRAGGRSRTLRLAHKEWQAAAKAGIVRTRSGRPYKPSAIRGYDLSMRLHILPDFGGYRLADLGRPELQRMCEKLLTAGKSASTVRNAVNPIRAIYRHAISIGEVTVNPTADLMLPLVESDEVQVTSPVEIPPLLAAVSDDDRALWATAFYTGLRRGELQALTWSDVDLEECIIKVRHGWDPKEGRITPKSRAGRRDVPLPKALWPYLRKHKLATGRSGPALVFGRTAEKPFTPDVPQRRADTRWKDAKLARVGMHQCRHTYASLMIAAGVNAKTLQRYMGHSSINVTMDRYGHLFPGSEAEAASQLDAFLEGKA